MVAHFRRTARGWVSFGGVLWLLASGCSKDAWLGSGPGAEAVVSTPSGVQSGLVTIRYTLKSEQVTETDIAVSYSKDGGSFQRATEGSGGSGTKNLAVSSTGTSHTFVWDSGTDLEGERLSTVFIRVQPEDGEGDLTEQITVHNAKFLLASEDSSPGRVRLFSVDVVDGRLSFLRAYTTGATGPQDVLFTQGFFVIAHEGSNDVAVFQLDEGTSSLIAVESTPFRGDGTGVRYLASDGSRIYASNPSGETITVFNFDVGSGKLTLNSHSGASAAGARALVVRSNRLYVASETTGAILVFDIASSGELLENGASPITTGGLTAPRALGFAGTRLYAANFDSSTICGFNFLGSGDLSPLGGSPFTVSASGVEAMIRNGSKLFAVNGAGALLLAFTIDAAGGITEDSGSPFALGSPATALASSGETVCVGTSTSREILSWTIGETGALSESSASPVAVGVELVRMAISD